MILPFWIVLGVVLRLLVVPPEPGFDEVWRLLSAEAPWPDLWKRSLLLLGGNPAYPAFLKLFGIVDEVSPWSRWPGILAFMMGMWMAWRIFRRWFGSRIAQWTLVALALSPFQVFHGVSLKEYSILLPVTLLGTWLGWEAAQPGGRRGWTWCALAATEVLGVLLALPTAWFWLALGIAQVIVHGVRGFRWRSWMAAHAPAALLAGWTIATWSQGYLPGFLHFGGTVRNDVLKWATDLVVYVQVWVWDPPARVQLGLRGTPLPGGVFTAYHLLWFLKHILPWLLGLPILLLGFFGWRRGAPVQRSSGVLGWCFMLAVGPVLAYGIFFAILGHPHLMYARVFYGSSPCLYVLLSIGAARLSGGARWVMAPILGAAGISLILMSLGRHPDQERPLGPTLRKWASELGNGEVAAVFPSEAFPYVRKLLPEPARDRIRPTEMRAARADLSWGPTLVDPRYIEDLSSWRDPDVRWLLVVPWALHWKDPELSSLQDGPVEWDLTVERPNLRIYRRRQLGMP
ncbi:MAG: glycosyltransferase family 39 protein [Nitrospirae bacterium]|nr:glycosyltransferase family 39 protein [Nitrospirota bacterium]